MKKLIQWFWCHVMGNHTWTSKAKEGILPKADLMTIEGFREYAKMYCKYCRKEYIFFVFVLFCLSCTTVKRTAWAARYENGNAVVLTAEGDKIVFPVKVKGSIGDKYIIRIKFKKVKK